MLKLFAFFKNSCELFFGDIRLYTFFKQLKKSNDSSCFDVSAFSLLGWPDVDIVQI
jgi:hypothetical protein